MAVNILTPLSTPIVYQAQLPSTPPPGGSNGDRPAHVIEIGKLGGILPDKMKKALFEGMGELEKSGANFDEIKSFADSELKANGVDMPGARQRTGLLVDMMS